MSNIHSIGGGQKAENKLLDDLSLHGYVRLPFRLSEAQVQHLREVFEANLEAEQAGKRVSGQGGQNILEILRQSPAFFEAVSQVIGKEGVLTRTLFFRKSKEVNWPLGWHQDVTIITKVSSEIPPGFGPVTYKDGLPHLKVTEQFLAGQLSARLHLDETDKDNGALEIITGSHRRGRLSQRTMAQEVMDDIPAYVPALSGEVHLFRPLLLHRSGKVNNDKIRRVIQLEMSSYPVLPAPLEWYEALPLKMEND